MSSTSSPHAKLSSASTPPSSVSPEPDDDIWGSDSPSASGSPSLDSAPRRDNILSEAPLVRRQQLTTGYREGVSVGKAQTMQDGFDQGYPLGAAIGLRVGYTKGVLEGIILSLSEAGHNETAEQLRKESKKIMKNLQVQEFLKGTEDQVVAKEEGLRQQISDQQNSNLNAAESASISSRTDNHTDSEDKSLFNKSIIDYLNKLEQDVEILLGGIHKRKGTT